jgi:hypothetical protein
MTWLTAAQRAALPLLALAAAACTDSPTTSPRPAAHPAASRAAAEASAGTADTANPIVGATLPTTHLTVTPTSLSFGSLLLGTTSFGQAVTVKNTGMAVAAISTITKSGDDFWHSSDCPVAPNLLLAGAACTITVVFHPTVLGARSGTLSFTSNSPESPHVVTLDGTGAPPTPAASVVPGSLGFGSVTVGLATSGRVVKVTSTGNVPLVISGAAVSGANAWDFAIVADDCSGVTLNPGASCTYKVGFEPFATGARSATLTITHNGVGGPSLVALSGSGVAPRGGIIP